MMFFFNFNKFLSTSLWTLLKEHIWNLNHPSDVELLMAGNLTPFQTSCYTFMFLMKKF